MRNDKLSPSIIFLIILLIALTVMNSYLLIEINRMIRSDSLVNDHYELAVISAKEVNLENSEAAQEKTPVLNSIGDMINYKVEFENGKAYFTLLSKKGATKYTTNDIIRTENEKTELKSITGKFVYGYVKELAPGNTGIFFLMNDGSIEYVSISNLLTKEELKTDNKFDDVKNVVNIFNAKVDGSDVLIALTTKDGYIVLDDLVN